MFFVYISTALLAAAAPARGDGGVDAEYLRLNRGAPDFLVRVTHLLNRAVSPGLNLVARAAGRVKGADEEFAGADWSALITRRDRTADWANVRLSRDGFYDNFFDGHWQASNGTRIPFTRFNRDVMHRLTRAYEILFRLHGELEAEVNASGTNARQLLGRVSYTGERVKLALDVGLETTLVAAAHLTADPSTGRGPEELLRRVTRAEGGKPSLMVHFALALPPTVLFPDGLFHRQRHPVRVRNDRVRFSRQMESALKTARARFSARKPDPTEFGHGCPVAHRLLGERTSALQNYLDAVMWIYDQVGPTAEN